MKHTEHRLFLAQILHIVCQRRLLVQSLQVVKTLAFLELKSPYIASKIDYANFLQICRYLPYNIAFLKTTRISAQTFYGLHI